nr:unnamed protein product [Callosobruchus chinensis]
MAEQVVARAVNIAELEWTIVLKFLCPSCDSFIYPPIGQCRRGHAYCPECFERMHRCLFCLSKKSTSRRCKFATKSNAIAGHEDNCEFSALATPLWLNNYEWGRRRAQLVSYCLNVHPTNVYFSACEQLKVERFIIWKDRRYFILFNAFDTWFRFNWTLDSNTKTLLFALYRLGTKPTQARYGYEINFVHSAQPANRVLLKGPSEGVGDDSVIILPETETCGDYDVMIYYSDGHGDRSYTVGIYTRIGSLRQEQL